MDLHQRNNDDAKSISTTISTRTHLQLDFALYASGSHESLGSWKRARRLQLSSPDFWQLTIDRVPEGTAFKFLLGPFSGDSWHDVTSFRWEADAEHRVTTRGYVTYHAPSFEDEQASSSPKRPKRDDSPTSRALLIGIQRYTHFPHLRGPINDVALVRRTIIDDFGYDEHDVVVLTDDSPIKPTREAILRALDDLVASAEPDAAVTIFFAAHGSRRRNSSKIGGWDETLVPLDSGRPTHGGVNRDITDDELHSYVGRLQRKTPYLTLIVDSCHSGHIVRNAFLRQSIRWVEPDETDVAVIGVSEQSAGSASFVSGVTSDFLPQRDGTPYSPSRGSLISSSSGWLPSSDGYVLLAACLRDEFASEKSISGLWHGAWTYELMQALAHCSSSSSASSTSYRDVFERASMRVSEAYPRQHPQMEGCVDRAVFGTQALIASPYARVTAVSTRCGRLGIILSIGSAHGATAGSVFSCYPAGTKVVPANDEGLLGTIEVEVVESVSCTAKVLSENSPIVPGSRAFERTHSFAELKLKTAILSERVTEETKVCAKALTTLLAESSSFISLIDDYNSSDAIVHLLCARSANEAANSRLSTLGALDIPTYVVTKRDGCSVVGEPVPATPSNGALVLSFLTSYGRYRRGLLLRNPTPNNPLDGKIDLVLLKRAHENGVALKPKTALLFP
ncbi:uncharacterized protein [Oscarella lobularis]|uniref:uncharacterized protein n=1 Tax=Oscarella lobularis TaxID=121494 RepID=UPI00331408AA